MKVYLSGTCGRSVWRELFINSFIKLNIKFFDPNVDEFTIKKEGKHLKEQNDSDIINISITSEEYSLGSLNEICLKLLDINLKDKTFIIYIEDSLDLKLMENQQLYNESKRLRTLIKEHLKRVENDNIILVGSLEESLKECLDIYEFKKYENFVERVKKAYPNYSKLIELVESKSSLTNQYFDGSYGGINEDEVLTLPFNKLKEKALLIKERKGLHKEFLDSFNF